MVSNIVERVGGRKLEYLSKESLKEKSFFLAWEDCKYSLKKKKMINCYLIRCTIDN